MMTPLRFGGEFPMQVSISMKRALAPGFTTLLITLFTSLLVLGAGSASAALPLPWEQGDIGSVAVAGSGSESGGTWTVAGSGADVWGNADGFHYVYQRLNGNMQVVVKVTTVQNQNVWSKAGLMIRDDLSAGARHASVFVTPGNGITFQSRTVANQISVSATTAGLAAPYWIKLVRNGNQFSAFRSPDNITWTQVGTTRALELDPVVYVGLAVTSHNNPVLCTSTFTNLSLIKPQVLLVASSATLNAGDAAVKKRLEILGYTVVVKVAAQSVTADANGKDLVLISSSITSADVNTKFKTVTQPVLLWENALLDDMGMTGTVGGTDFGTTTLQTQATIYTAACNRATMYTAATGWGDGCQDMSAGLTGNVNITRSAQTFSWGVPNANAIKIAYHAGNQARAVDFAYEKAAAMPGLAAPARRVFLFMEDNTASNWSPRGQALFDNAVYWATGSKYYLTRKVLVLNYDPILGSKGGIRLHQYNQPSPRQWNWNDPVVLERDYLADIYEASGGYVRWKWAFYPEIPTYLNKWVQITGAEQFGSATFTEQDYIDGYNVGIDTRDWGAAARAMPQGGFYTADYVGMFSQFNVEAKVTAGEVDEVIIYAHAFAGLNESAMAGDQAYNLNGPVIWRPGIKNFVVMGLNYERGRSEALESFGHRAEWLLDRHAFVQPADEIFTIPYYPCIWSDFPAGDYCGSTRQPTPQRSIYDKFSTVEGLVAGNAGVGAAHWAPNARNRGDEYNWSLANTAYTMADDWQYNYPTLTGAATKRLVNLNEWTPYAQDADAGRGFKKWWFMHFPRVAGLYPNDGNVRNRFRLNNWWEYIMDYNKHSETQH